MKPAWRALAVIDDYVYRSSLGLPTESEDEVVTAAVQHLRGRQTCPTCYGVGEVTDCSGLPSCSHTFDNPYPCDTCQGTGEIDAP